MLWGFLPSTRQPIVIFFMYSGPSGMYSCSSYVSKKGGEKTKRKLQHGPNIERISVNSIFCRQSSNMLELTFHELTAIHYLV